MKVTVDEGQLDFAYDMLVMMADDNIEVSAMREAVQDPDWWLSGYGRRHFVDWEAGAPWGLTKSQVEAYQIGVVQEICRMLNLWKKKLKRKPLVFEPSSDIPGYPEVAQRCLERAEEQLGSASGPRARDAIHWMGGLSYLESMFECVDAGQLLGWLSIEDTVDDDAQSLFEVLRPVVWQYVEAEWNRRG